MDEPIVCATVDSECLEYLGCITLDWGLVFRAHTKLDLAVSNVLQVASFMQIVHLIWFVRYLYFLKGT